MNPALQTSLPDYYALLGLDRRCTEVQVRAAYRVLAKLHHPDVNGGSCEALARTQELNAAYEVLSDPVRRRDYDAEVTSAKRVGSSNKAAKTPTKITQDVHLSLVEFLRGARLEVRVNDPGNSDGVELYELIVPPDTAPGTRFRLPRTGSATGGLVVVSVKARADFRFKVRGSDVRCDLKINFQRALQGGVESVRGVNGNVLRVQIPPKVTNGEVICLGGEGLPRPRGGRGDLLVRVTYRPQVRIQRVVR